MHFRLSDRWLGMGISTIYIIVVGLGVYFFDKTLSNCDIKSQKTEIIMQEIITNNTDNLIIDIPLTNKAITSITITLKINKEGKNE